jgi:hypothetical protein
MFESAWGCPSRAMPESLKTGVLPLQIQVDAGLKDLSSNLYEIESAWLCRILGERRFDALDCRSWLKRTMLISIRSEGRTPSPVH